MQNRLALIASNFLDIHRVQSTIIHVPLSFSEKVQNSLLHFAKIDISLGD